MSTNSIDSITSNVNATFQNTGVANSIAPSDMNSAYIGTISALKAYSKFNYIAKDSGSIDGDVFFFESDGSTNTTNFLDVKFIKVNVKTQSGINITELSKSKSNILTLFFDNGNTATFNCVNATLSGGYITHEVFKYSTGTGSTFSIDDMFSINYVSLSGVSGTSGVLSSFASAEPDVNITTVTYQFNESNVVNSHLFNGKISVASLITKGSTLFTLNKWGSKTAYQPVVFIDNGSPVLTYLRIDTSGNVTIGEDFKTTDQLWLNSPILE